MLRRFSSASSSSSSVSLHQTRLLPSSCGVPLLLTSKNFKSKKVTYANCTKYEAYAARQHGFASRLEVAAPLVAREWDYNKNPTKYFPSTLSCSSLQPFWWKCGECGWSYQMSPERRTIRGQGCPKCAGVEIVEVETEHLEETIATSIEKKKKKLNRKMLKRPSFLLNTKTKTKATEINKSKINKNTNDEEEGVLPGEVDPRLKALISGKAMMK